MVYFDIRQFAIQIQPRQTIGIDVSPVYADADISIIPKIAGNRSNPNPISLDSRWLRYPNKYPGIWIIVQKFFQSFLR